MESELLKEVILGQPTEYERQIIGSEDIESTQIDQNDSLALDEWIGWSY